MDQEQHNGEQGRDRVSLSFHKKKESDGDLMRSSSSSSFSTCPHSSPHLHVPDCVTSSLSLTSGDSIPHSMSESSKSFHFLPSLSSTTSTASLSKEGGGVKPVSQPQSDDALSTAAASQSSSCHLPVPPSFTPSSPNPVSPVLCASSCSSLHHNEPQPRSPLSSSGSNQGQGHCGPRENSDGESSPSLSSSQLLLPLPPRQPLQSFSQKASSTTNAKSTHPIRRRSSSSSRGELNSPSSSLCPPGIPAFFTPRPPLYSSFSSFREDHNSLSISTRASLGMNVVETSASAGHESLMQASLGASKEKTGRDNHMTSSSLLQTAERGTTSRHGASRCAGSSSLCISSSHPSLSLSVASSSSLLSTACSNPCHERQVSGPTIEENFATVYSSSSFASPSHSSHPADARCVSLGGPSPFPRAVATPDEGKACAGVRTAAAGAVLGAEGDDDFYWSFIKPLRSSWKHLNGEKETFRATTTTSTTCSPGGYTTPFPSVTCGASESLHSTTTTSSSSSSSTSGSTGVSASPFSISSSPCSSLGYAPEKRHLISLPLPSTAAATPQSTRLPSASPSPSSLCSTTAPVSGCSSFASIFFERPSSCFRSSTVSILSGDGRAFPPAVHLCPSSSSSSSASSFSSCSSSPSCRQASTASGSPPSSSAGCSPQASPSSSRETSLQGFFVPGRARLYSSSILEGAGRGLPHESLKLVPGDAISSLSHLPRRPQFTRHQKEQHHQQTRGHRKTCPPVVHSKTSSGLFIPVSSSSSLSFFSSHSHSLSSPHCPPLPLLNSRMSSSAPSPSSALSGERQKDWKDAPLSSRNSEPLTAPPLGALSSSRSPTSSVPTPVLSSQAPTPRSSQRILSSPPCPLPSYSSSLQSSGVDLDSVVSSTHDDGHPSLIRAQGISPYPRRCLLPIAHLEEGVDQHGRTTSTNKEETLLQERSSSSQGDEELSTKESFSSVKESTPSCDQEERSLENVGNASPSSLQDRPTMDLGEDEETKSLSQPRSSGDRLHSNLSPRHLLLRPQTYLSRPLRRRRPAQTPTVGLEAPPPFSHPVTRERMKVLRNSEKFPGVLRAQRWSERGMSPGEVGLAREEVLDQRELRQEDVPADASTSVVTGVKVRRYTTDSSQQSDLSCSEGRGRLAAIESERDEERRKEWILRGEGERKEGLQEVEISFVRRNSLPRLFQTECQEDEQERRWCKESEAAMKSSQPFSRATPPWPPEAQSHTSPLFSHCGELSLLHFFSEKENQVEVAKKGVSSSLSFGRPYHSLARDAPFLSLRCLLATTALSVLSQLQEDLLLTTQCLSMKNLPPKTISSYEGADVCKKVDREDTFVLDSVIKTYMIRKIRRNSWTSLSPALVIQDVELSCEHLNREIMREETQWGSLDGLEQGRPVKDVKKNQLQLMETREGLKSVHILEVEDRRDSSCLEEDEGKSLEETREGEAGREDREARPTERKKQLSIVERRREDEVPRDEEEREEKRKLLESLRRRRTRLERFQRLAGKLYNEAIATGLLFPSLLAVVQDDSQYTSAVSQQEMSRGESNSKRQGCTKREDTSSYPLDDGLHREEQVDEEEHSDVSDGDASIHSGWLGLRRREEEPGDKRRILQRFLAGEVLRQLVRLVSSGSRLEDDDVKRKNEKVCEEVMGWSNAPRGRIVLARRDSIRDLIEGEEEETKSRRQGWTRSTAATGEEEERRRHMLNGREREAMGTIGEEGEERFVCQKIFPQGIRIPLPHVEGPLFGVYTYNFTLTRSKREEKGVKTSNEEKRGDELQRGFCSPLSLGDFLLPHLLPSLSSSSSSKGGCVLPRNNRDSRQSFVSLAVHQDLSSPSSPSLPVFFCTSGRLRRGSILSLQGEGGEATSFLGPSPSSHRTLWVEEVIELSCDEEEEDEERGEQDERNEEKRKREETRGGGEEQNLTDGAPVTPSETQRTPQAEKAWNTRRERWSFIGRIKKPAKNRLVFEAGGAGQLVAVDVHVNDPQQAMRELFLSRCFLVRHQAGRLLADQLQERKERKRDLQSLEREKRKQTGRYDKRDQQNRTPFLPSHRRTALQERRKDTPFFTPFSRMSTREAKAFRTQTESELYNKEVEKRRQEEEKEKRDGRKIQAKSFERDLLDRLLLRTALSSQERRTLFAEGPSVLSPRRTRVEENKGEIETRETERREGERVCLFATPQGDKKNERQPTNAEGGEMLSLEERRRQLEQDSLAAQEKGREMPQLGDSGEGSALNPVRAITETNESSVVTSGRHSLLSTCSTGVASGGEDVRSRPSITPPYSWGSTVSPASIADADSRSSDLIATKLHGPCLHVSPPTRGTKGEVLDSHTTQVDAIVGAGHLSLSSSSSRTHVPRPSLSDEANEAAVEASLTILRHVTATAASSTSGVGLLPPSSKSVKTSIQPDTTKAVSWMGSSQIEGALTRDGGAAVVSQENKSLLLGGIEKGKSPVVDEEKLDKIGHHSLRREMEKKISEELHGRWLLPYELHFCCRDSLSPVDLGLAGSLPEHLLSLHLIHQEDKKNSVIKRRLKEAAWTMACDLTKEGGDLNSRSDKRASSTMNPREPEEVSEDQEGVDEDDDTERSPKEGTVCMLIAPTVPYALSLGDAFSLFYWDRDIGSPPPELALFCAYELCELLRQLHWADLIHGDLQETNFLIHPSRDFLSLLSGPRSSSSLFFKSSHQESYTGIASVAARRAARGREEEEGAEDEDTPDEREERFLSKKEKKTSFPPYLTPSVSTSMASSALLTAFKPCPPSSSSPSILSGFSPLLDQSHSSGQGTAHIECTRDATPSSIQDRRRHVDNETNLSHSPPSLVSSKSSSLLHTRSCPSSSFHHPLLPQGTPIPECLISGRNLGKCARDLRMALHSSDVSLGVSRKEVPVQHMEPGLGTDSLESTAPHCMAGDSRHSYEEESIVNLGSARLFSQLHGVDLRGLATTLLSTFFPSEEKRREAWESQESNQCVGYRSDFQVEESRQKKREVKREGISSSSSLSSAQPPCFSSRDWSVEGSREDLISRFLRKEEEIYNGETPRFRNHLDIFWFRFFSEISSFDGSCLSSTNKRITRKLLRERHKGRWKEERIAKEGEEEKHLEKGCLIGRTSERRRGDREEQEENISSLHISITRRGTMNASNAEKDEDNRKAVTIDTRERKGDKREEEGEVERKMNVMKMGSREEDSKERGRRGKAKVHGGSKCDTSEKEKRRKDKEKITEEEEREAFFNGSSKGEHNLFVDRETYIEEFYEQSKRLSLMLLERQMQRIRLIFEKEPYRKDVLSKHLSLLEKQLVLHADQQILNEDLSEHHHVEM